MASTYRKELKQGPITVAYGHDHCTGYFISVHDSRLANGHTMDRPFNDFCYEITGSELGAYVQAHTATIGFGKRVLTHTMKILWKLYGVEESEVESIKDEFAGP